MSDAIAHLLDDESLRAELIRRGDQPYADFVHVNLPVLEQGLAGCFALFGTSIRTAEVLSALFVLAACLAAARLSIAGAVLLCAAATGRRSCSARIWTP